MQAVALGVSYYGAPFSGWQRQADAPSVQEALETALSKVASSQIEIFAAGRTDKGVHATGQVVHFHSEIHRRLEAWLCGTNHFLPQSIAVDWAIEVPEDFHARFSALKRRYRYILYNHRVRPALLRNNIAWYSYPLNIDNMKAALPAFLGEHDFSALRSSECQARSPIRTIEDIRLYQKQAFLILDITANSFLHHMVRNIMGILLTIGRDLKPSSWVAEVLASKDRTQASITAPAEGLYLVDVKYPERFDLPFNPIGPSFLINENE